ncbi:MAG: hypothetical protein COW66_05295 [Flavobacteriaceae bacterium CG18_big_fil_WC_8_21_14_2_50_34_36]|nr:MAG: hypothetical protein COW66_05295 [Flavobacteriaceae bacterium CG18_big_fil_WC_8_21_14_2_50_34_36]PIV50055.1 MAG: hypothetical protein COS19_05220 [Flavobacteriaceae bacterium CG02_land_8_20_14_3_00_34_13]PIZ09087.1 MAG: hypothetical protein COY56_00570 [Flavobacteriaceae bacterium CG_4_10_14_0_8_um_filter_34_31]PJC07937.1 MAG: hypothetical protein CO068_03525 [Flavobacteriaceae bacterium CG_4_9_14_0_8_um_filter_34_30]
MELQKMEQLIDKYFDGNTSKEEEKQLHQYFKSNQVATHLEVYRSMFAYFSESKKEVFPAEVPLDEVSKNGMLSKFKSWYSLAALLIVVIGITFFMQQNSNQLTSEEKEAVAAFEKTKEALNYISQQFNESSQQLAYITEFGTSANKIFK